MAAPRPIRSRLPPQEAGARRDRRPAQGPRPSRATPVAWTDAPPALPASKVPSTLKSVAVYIASIAGVLLAAYAGLALYGRDQAWDALADAPDPGAYDFVAPVRSGKPNDYLVCPAGECAAALPEAASPRYAAPPDAVFAALREVMVAEGITEAAAADEPGRKVSAIARTPLMRFPDRVTAMVSGDADGPASVWIYSASRIGHSDLGTNRRRVESLIGALDGRFSRAAP